MPGHGISNSPFLTTRYGGGGGYTPSAEALAWEADIIANGGSIAADVLQAVDENFIIPNVAGGNWPINPFTEGVSQNDVSVGYIVKTPPFAATVRAFGCTDAVSTKRLEVYELAGQSFVFLNCSHFTANPNDTSVGNVLLAGKRSDAANATAIISASEVTAADASTGVPNHNAFELISNNNGTPYPADFDTQPHLFSWHGTSAVDTALLKSTIDALEIALAAL
jgi:hypothetical protein